MKQTIHEGLTANGVLPGILGTQRRAQKLYNQRHIDESASASAAAAIEQAEPISA